MLNKQLHSCSQCAMSELCLPLGVDKDELKSLEELVDSSSPLHRGDTIYRQGERFEKIYAVKSGSLKSVLLDENGEEHILGFYLPGELVGLDGIYPERYASSAIALETVVTCEIDYSRLSELCSKVASLQKQVFRLLSRDIYESHNELSVHAELTAEQKLANFINNLSARYEARGFLANQFPLSMPRQDIANYLGMAPETVSRLLKRFKEQGLLNIDKNVIYIPQQDALTELVHCQNQ